MYRVCSVYLIEMLKHRQKEINIIQKVLQFQGSIIVVSQKVKIKNVVTNVVLTKTCIPFIAIKCAQANLYTFTKRLYSLSIQICLRTLY